MKTFKKEELKMAKDLALETDDLYYIKLKAYLYQMAALAINNSGLTHEEIAKISKTSRARISRISKMGENSLSLDFLIRITDLLYEEPLVNFTSKPKKLKAKKKLDKALHNVA